MQVLVRGSIMDGRMTKVECDVLMHLLHRQCVHTPLLYSASLFL